MSVEDCLRQVLGVIQPVDGDWQSRFQVLQALRQVAASLDSFRGATVEPFGSFVSNLFTRSGDLDISIHLANGLFISSSAKKEKQKLLRALMRAMRRNGAWYNFQFIPQARVPILKVESNNISCDISIDNLQAQMKSKFLLWLSTIDTRFRDMVLLVKEWAKAQNINNPKCGTFNSYSLSLLVIFHFQTCVPAIFPPLQDIYSGNVADELQGMRAEVVTRIQETCTLNIARFRSNTQRAENRSSLSELFITFLAKFSNIGEMASYLGVCPFKGYWEVIQNNTRWLPQNHAIYIEDPFEQPANSARAVNEAKLERISEAFRSSHEKLLSANQSQHSVLATLAQHQTARLITGRNVGGHHHPPPQRTVNHYAQVGGQFQPPPQRTANHYAQVREHHQPPPQTTVSLNAHHVGGHHHPSTQRTVNPDAAVQPRRRPRRNRSQVLNSSAAAYVPAQANESPQQQIWRPRPR